MMRRLFLAAASLGAALAPAAASAQAGAEAICKTEIANRGFGGYAVEQVQVRQNLVVGLMRSGRELLEFQCDIDNLGNVTEVRVEKARGVAAPRVDPREADRAREAERQREAERLREAERQRQAERQREAERQRQAEIERQRQAERQREAERQRQAEFERQREAERQRQAERQREADRLARERSRLEAVEYQRGYSDGYRRMPYNNYRGSDEYERGYDSGYDDARRGR